jgi:hypothetical protein
MVKVFHCQHLNLCWVYCGLMEEEEEEGHRLIYLEEGVELF